MGLRRYRLMLVPAAAAGLAILVTGCESEEIKAARLDAEAKWAAAHEARAAIPTEERIESAKQSVALAEENLATVREEAEPAARAAATAAVPEDVRRLGRQAGIAQLLAGGERDFAFTAGLGALSNTVKQAEEDAFEKALAATPEVVAAREALRSAYEELETAVTERDDAIALSDELTAAAEEATAFLEAAKRAP